MEKNINFSIFASFLGLWLTTLLPERYEVLFGFLLIFSFGIFHGSNDILLINTLSSNSNKRFSLKVLLIYIATVLLAVLLLYIVPGIALLLFIVFSAFHFGEQQYEHWKFNISPILKASYYFSYGLLVLFLLFVLNPIEVKDIVKSIVDYSVEKQMILYSFYGVAALYVGFTAYLIYREKHLLNRFLMEVLYLVCLAIIFEVSTLIWGFTIYFIFWHSIPSLLEQVNFLSGSITAKSILSYLKNALVYWIISLVGISLLYVFFGSNTIFYGILFSFIAAVTFPHTLVINAMFRSKKTQPTE